MINLLPHPEMSPTQRPHSILSTYFLQGVTHENTQDFSTGSGNPHKYDYITSSTDQRRNEAGTGWYLHHGQHRPVEKGKLEC